MTPLGQGLLVGRLMKGLSGSLTDTVHEWVRVRFPALGIQIAFSYPYSIPVESSY